MEIRGAVFSGVNNARGLVAERAGAIRRAIGHDVVPGTLNVWLDRPVAFDNGRVRRVDGSRFGLWPARLNGSPVWVFRHDRMALHVAELVADRNLRDALDLHDGDLVSLAVDPGLLVGIPATGWLAWRVFWSGRTRRAFVSPAHAARARRWGRRLGATQDSVETSSPRLLARLAAEALASATAALTPRARSR